MCTPHASVEWARRPVIPCVFQVRELVDYLARGHSDDDRQKSFGQIIDLVKTEPPPEGETSEEPPTISKANQAKVLSLLVSEVKGLGEGSEKGA